MTLLRSTAIILALATPAFAVGTDDNKPPEPTETTAKCEEGFVWDEKQQLCVEIKDSRLNDDAIFENARELAYFGQPDNAILLLEMAANPSDPRILNYLGFSHRKAGRMALAMDYYERALAADPDYAMARSYMGMGYVSMGRYDLAKAQLGEIRARGGQGGYPYWALKNAITTGALSAY